ncbi:hypothetical protein LXT12_16820 [Pelomonas sp. P7]|uniref:YD repeat-containing protein n=1 Tax=Pelomonas caseinilytica TaxID=2906763 RepID=A0ABS8XK00_9BURK|nr:hypothetical protein [Pelomonas sp. P7]MCE4538918.1 hypothetical protein [Pelomonas sp. P7]
MQAAPLSAGQPAAPTARRHRRGAAVYIAGALAGLLSLLHGSLATAAGYYDEQGYFVREAKAVSSLGPQLFGEQVNHSNGGVSFVQTDISLKGNSALPMAVARSLRSSPALPFTVGHFGKWDLEIPRVHGFFTSKGFTNASYGTNRCSSFSAPPNVSGSKGGWFFTKEYWQGNMLYVPGAGDQEILKRDPSVAAPADGNSYPLSTRELWMIRCIPLAAGGTGEGFLAVSPSGVQYQFDRLVQRTAGSMQNDYGSSTGRVDVWILPSVIRDRFGNTVTFTYDATTPMRLLKMTASDGRAITFTYGTGNRIATASDGVNTWSYGYDGTGDLSSVTLPDSSTWTFSHDPYFFYTDASTSPTRSVATSGKCRRGSAPSP